MGGGGGGTLCKCQYGAVPLTWLEFTASLVHSWGVNLHTVTKFEQFGILTGGTSPIFVEFQRFWHSDGW